MKRLREWMILPIAYLGILTWPIWWLVTLPNDVRCRHAVRGARRDPGVALAGLARLRVIVCNLPSTASMDEDCFYELTYADGSRRVILDNDGDLQRRLTARGTTPFATLHYTESHALIWFSWLFATGATLILAVLLLAICR
jgi:hypothetical protein